MHYTIAFGIAQALYRLFSFLFEVFALSCSSSGEETDQVLGQGLLFGCVEDVDDRVIFFHFKDDR